MILVIIPTYNERENIARIIPQVLAQHKDIHILVVDDNSPDQTGKVVEDLMAGECAGRLHILRRAGKLGLGTAYIAGFKWALGRDYQYIFEMDADFSHNPDYIPDFLREIEHSDLVIGSRYVAGGGVKNWGMIRQMISRGGSLYSRLILGLHFRDLTGGFKCFRREVLASLNLEDIRSNGYSFQIEMTYRTFLKGFRIREIPIIFEDRTLGKSKMSRKIFLEAVFMVLKLRRDKNHFQL